MSNHYLHYLVSMKWKKSINNNKYYHYHHVQPFHIYRFIQSSSTLFQFISYIFYRLFSFLSNKIPIFHISIFNHLNFPIPFQLLYLQYAYRRKAHHPRATFTPLSTTSLTTNTQPSKAPYTPKTKSSQQFFFKLIVTDLPPPKRPPKFQQVNVELTPRGARAIYPNNARPICQRLDVGRPLPKLIYFVRICLPRRGAKLNLPSGWALMYGPISLMPCVYKVLCNIRGLVQDEGLVCFGVCVCAGVWCVLGSLARRMLRVKCANSKFAISVCK